MSCPNLSVLSLTLLPPDEEFSTDMEDAKLEVREKDLLTRVAKLRTLNLFGEAYRIKWNSFEKWIGNELEVLHVTRFWHHAIPDG